MLAGMGAKEIRDFWRKEKSHEENEAQNMHDVDSNLMCWKDRLGKPSRTADKTIFSQHSLA
jgi:hypothetical protein